MEDKSLLGSQFLAHQVQALDYLYDMPIANDSLFIAEIHGIGIENCSRFRVKKISFAPTKIKYDQDDKRRLSLISGVERSDTVTIEWYEDAFNTIQKWHLNMVNSRYNNTTGLWNVGNDSGWSFDADIYHFAYVEGNDDANSPFDSVAFPKCTEIIKLSGLKSEGIPEITYDSDGGSSMKTISVTYHCNFVKIEDTATAASEWKKDDVSGISTEIGII